MRFLRQSLTGLFLAFATIGMILYAGAMVRDAVGERMAQDGRKPPQREREFTVAVVTAMVENVSPVLQVFGQIESRRSLEIRAAVAGRVLELSDNFQEGGSVKAGDVLLQIDPLDSEAALQRAEANLADAELEVRDAARALVLARDELTATEEQAELRAKAYARQTDLAGRGVATAAAVETAELAASSARQSVVGRRQSLAQAEARVDKAATALNRAQIARDEVQRQLDDTTVTAKFDGTLSEVAAVAGGLVTTNEQLAQLVDGSALEVAFRVSNTQYARLLDDTGALRQAPVTVVLDVSGIDLSTEGRISRDSAVVAEGQSGRLIFATLDSPRGMKPGDFVTVEVQEPELARVIRLPAKALAADGSVLVVGEGDRLESFDVTLLRRQGDEVLVRAKGLAGKAVVRERTPLLGAGIKVKALQPAAATTVEEPAMVALSAEDRAKLVAFVEANTRMPEEVKTRLLAALQQDMVPAQMVERLQTRMGG